MPRTDKPFEIPAPDTIPVQRRAPLQYRAARTLVLKPLMHSLFRVKVQGRELLPATSFVAIANHSGWADGMILAHTLRSSPRPHFFGDPTSMIKATVRVRIPRTRITLLKLPIGRVLWWDVKRIGGLICVNRTNHGDPRLREQGDAAATAGALAGFAEGRYLRLPGENPDELLGFKKGLAHNAIHAQVPIVPVTINYARRLWLGKRIDVVVNAPIETAGSTDADAERLTRAARQAIATTHRPDDVQGRFRLLERHLTLGKTPSAGTRATLNGSLVF